MLIFVLSNKEIKSHTKTFKIMTYAQITRSMKNHQTAAQVIRTAGFAAKCVKNTECEQPYQVNVKCTVEEAKQLQVMMCKMLKDDTINIVCQ